MIDMLHDTPLKVRVHTALQSNPHVRNRDLHLETERGRVTLRGEVGTYFQKQMAQEAVRYVDGVCEISNELQVCST